MCILYMEHEIPGSRESFFTLGTPQANSPSFRCGHITLCRFRDWQFFYSTTFLLTASLLLLLALAGEPHLAVVLLVVQHVHQVIEQLPAVPTNKDVRITVCFQAS